MCHLCPFQEAIEAVLEEEQLQRVPSFISKVIQVGDENTSVASTPADYAASLYDRPSYVRFKPFVAGW